MRINYIKGDLLSVTSCIIMHGCNAQGVMGSGVALAVRWKYPKAYEKYKQGIQLGCLGMGEAQIVKVSEGLFVCNAVTQEFYGREKKLYVSYEAIREAFWSVFSVARRFGYTVNIPKIGAGLGGGDWKVILGIIKESAEEQCYTGDLNIYEL
jgi:O-acetyl-ADP-ribose deacetylase (regulator of RNase III)